MSVEHGSEDEGHETMGTQEQDRVTVGVKQRRVPRRLWAHQARRHKGHPSPSLQSHQEDIEPKSVGIDLETVVMVAGYRARQGELVQWGMQGDAYWEWGQSMVKTNWR
jgi:hypothetical protein